MPKSVQSPGRSECKVISRANRVLTVAITWLVIVAGCYFFSVASPGPETKWEQFPSLPERATSIELTRFGYVRVYVESGSSYMTYLYAWQDQPWALYDAATEAVYGEPCEINVSSQFHPPSPPGEPISRSNADCFASAESNFYADVVLLENNEVWLWTHLYNGAGEVYSSLVYLAGALGVVLLLIGGMIKLYDGE